MPQTHKNDLEFQMVPASSRDLERALPDIIAMRTGQDPVRPGNPHPLAIEYQRTNLKSLVAALGGLLDTSNGEEASRAFRAGMQSHHFQTALELTGRTLVGRAYRANDAARRVCRPLPRPDFQPARFMQVTVDGLQEGTGNSDLPLIRGRVSEQLAGGLKTWTGMVLIDRETVINNDADLIAQTWQEIGHMMSRNEAREVFSFLESNPTVPELDNRNGAPRAWFTANDGNLLTGQTADLAGIAAASAALRKQTGSDGQPEGIAPRFLVAPVEHEMDLAGVIHDRGLQLQLMVSPFLDPGRFYLMADPAGCPAVGLQFLGDPGDEISTWSISPARKLPATMEGKGYHINQDMRPVALSRRGIVRVELS